MAERVFLSAQGCRLSLVHTQAPLLWNPRLRATLDSRSMLTLEAGTMAEACDTTQVETEGS